MNKIYVNFTKNLLKILEMFDYLMKFRQVGVKNSFNYFW